jgi:LPS sulfotransferase NodH
VSRSVLRHARAQEIRAFANPENDGSVTTPVTDVLIVLSTPRSGSSYMCDLFEKAGLGEGREYLNPSALMPVQADRWGCVRRGLLDFVAYGRALAQRRVAPSGWLTIKVHASHLSYLTAVMPAYAEARIHWVLIRRRDALAQAVSYAIARQTRKWSTQHAGRTDDARYSYREIGLCLRRIETWNQVLEAFVRARALPAVDYVYEDFVAAPDAHLRRLPVLEEAHLELTNLRVARQANARNAEWMERYRAELLDREERHNRSVPRRLLIDARRRLGSLMWG